METLILATVLLSGYIFSNRHPYLSFKLEKTSGLITYLMAGATGLGFCLISAFITILIITVLGLSVNSPVCDFYPYIDYFSVFFFLWILLSIGLAYIIGELNYRSVDKNIKATEKICQENAFRRKIYEGLVNEKIFQVTLKNNKVYVGQVLTVSLELVNSKMEFFSLCPIMSGYRKQKTHQIKFTNSYLQYYFERKKKMKENDTDSFFDLLNEFTVVIPVNEIISLGFFDPDAYKIIN